MAYEKKQVKKQKTKVVKNYYKTIRFIKKTFINVKVDKTKVLAILLFIRHNGNPNNFYSLYHLDDFFAGKDTENVQYFKKWKIRPRHLKYLLNLLVKANLGEFFNDDNCFRLKPSTINNYEKEDTRFMKIDVAKHIDFRSFYYIIASSLILDSIAKQHHAKLHRHFYNEDNKSNPIFTSKTSTNPAHKAKYKAYAGELKATGYNSSPHVSCRMLGELLGVSHTTANKIINELDGKVLSFKEDIVTVQKNCGGGAKYYEDPKGIYTYEYNGDLKAHLGRTVKIIPLHNRTGIFRDVFMQGDISKNITYQLAMKTLQDSELETIFSNKESKTRDDILPY